MFSEFCCFPAVVQQSADSKPFGLESKLGLRPKLWGALFPMITPFVLDFVARVPESFLDLTTVGVMDGVVFGGLRRPNAKLRRCHLVPRGQNCCSRPPPRLLRAAAVCTETPPVGALRQRCYLAPLASTLFRKGSH